jgi:ribosomal protein S3
VLIDEEEERIEVVVPDDQLSLAIGRRGQNVRLASILTASAIDIMTETDSSEKRQREFIEKSEMFQQELDVDETLAQLLVAEGFSTMEEIAYVSRMKSPPSKVWTMKSRPNFRSVRRNRWIAAKSPTVRRVRLWALKMPWLNCRI